jgi:hypothetical protein
MSAVLAAIKSEVTRTDVEVAWATYRALILAECDDPKLQEDSNHQLAIARSKQTFERLYVDWTHQ